MQKGSLTRGGTGLHSTFVLRCIRTCAEKPIATAAVCGGVGDGESSACEDFKAGGEGVE